MSKEASRRARVLKKRSSVVFKKAMELNRITGADILVLVRTPSEQPGAPNPRKMIAYSSTHDDWVRGWYDMTCDTIRHRTQVYAMTTGDYDTLFSKKNGQWSRIGQLPRNYTTRGDVHILDDLEKVQGHPTLFLVDDAPLHEMHPSPVDGNMNDLFAHYRVPIRESHLYASSAATDGQASLRSESASEGNSHPVRVDVPWPSEEVTFERTRACLYAHALRHTTIKGDSLLDPLTVAHHLGGSVPRGGVYVGVPVCENMPNGGDGGPGRRRPL